MTADRAQGEEREPTQTSVEDQHSARASEKSVIVLTGVETREKWYMYY